MFDQLVNAGNMYIEMKDGTIKQINPFSGTEVWCVPGRGVDRFGATGKKNGNPLQKHDPEDYCPFCSDRLRETPPEKSRVVFENGNYRIYEKLPGQEYQKNTPLFRRVANLFEIVGMRYWECNYEYKISGNNLDWMTAYTGTPEGRKHVEDTVRTKLTRQGLSEKEINAKSYDEILGLSRPFFAGSHELIIGCRHYRDNAETEEDLFSSGDFSPEEHYQYISFVINSIADIYSYNRYVRYVTVFQNWLKPAGASFDHLHKQLVGLDEWGLSVENEIRLLQKKPNVYNELIVNFSSYHNLIIAENEYAIAFAEIGHRYPTIAVYSKSKNCRPFEHGPDEVRGFSDLLHACHRALGGSFPCNEEWYYAPVDAVVRMPWHVLIKLRTIQSAGFEGGTKIHVNPVSPYALRDMVVDRIYELRDKKEVHVERIAEECSGRPNLLRYIEG
ncbi:MAG: DUF4921 family protein [Fibrobacterota bacterium]